MRTFQLTFVFAILFSIISCTDGGTLPHYKVESAVQHAYRYRTMDLKDSLAKYVDNFDDTQFQNTKNEFGDIKIYNLDQITEEGSGADKKYIAVYNVEYDAAEGTETFEVKSIQKLPKIVSYSRDIQPVEVDVIDSMAIATDSIE